ncbi:heavy-metal-associated domain-containing protein [archaeon]|nr:heavy-metal-associated domain-containing protein [archaeon]MBT4352910.1 heavy-metal-associated domain-containing protein [archaeon]MBT4648466.1 heavy-metal-associated domain-containing protein [archaeon]MBT6821725.1 heavy-metal-associated domain-containing protein [archaeon]MBT7391388.1 heavy-metal-associated domain-containing protein [archaeon]
MEKIKLSVKGMHCKACEMLIEDGLSETEGIDKTNISHEEGYVEVSYDENKIDVSKIKKIIVQEGYKVE